MITEILTLSKQEDYGCAMKVILLISKVRLNRESNTEKDFYYLQMAKASRDNSSKVCHKGKENLEIYMGST